MKSILLNKATAQLEEQIKKELEQEDPQTTKANEITDENTIKHDGTTNTKPD